MHSAFPGQSTIDYMVADLAVHFVYVAGWKLFWLSMEYDRSGSRWVLSVDGNAMSFCFISSRRDI